MAFYTNHDKLREGMKLQIECSIEQTYGLISASIDCETIDRATLSPFWFISWIIACLTAVLAQLILSCHVQTRERYQQQVLTRIGIGLDMPQLQGVGMQGMVRGHTNSNLIKKDNNNNNNNINNIDAVNENEREKTEEREKSGLHGAEGYRTEDGTIIGMNRRITDTGDNLNAIEALAPYIASADASFDDEDGISEDLETKQNARISMLGMRIDGADTESPGLPSQGINGRNMNRRNKKKDTVPKTIDEDHTYKESTFKDFDGNDSNSKSKSKSSGSGGKMKSIMNRNSVNKNNNMNNNNNRNANTDSYNSSYNTTMTTMNSNNNNRNDMKMHSFTASSMSTESNDGRNEVLKQMANRNMQHQQYHLVTNTHTSTDESSRMFLFCFDLFAFV